MSDFTQVVVWPGTLLGPDSTPEEFEQFILEELKSRAKFIGEFVTKPDFGDHDPEAGGRKDLFFYVHTEDIPKFAMPRFAYDMRWLEDVLDNEKHRNIETGAPEDYSIYSDEVRKLYS